MTTTTGRTSSPALHIARAFGALGPVVRCSGELSVATWEALKRELDMLGSQHAVIVNVSGCRVIDAHTAGLLLQTYRRLHDQGRAFAVVAETDSAAVLLDPGHAALPVFPTEISATLALPEQLGHEHQTA